jgi:hypothetical protein
MRSTTFKMWLETKVMRGKVKVDLAFSFLWSFQCVCVCVCGGWVWLGLDWISLMILCFYNWLCTNKNYNFSFFLRHSTCDSEVSRIFIFKIWSPYIMLSHKHTRKWNLGSPRKRWISQIWRAATDKSPMHKTEELCIIFVQFQSMITDITFFCVSWEQVHSSYVTVL